MKVGDTVTVMYGGEEVSAVVTKVHSDKVLDVEVSTKSGSKFVRTSVVLQDEPGALHEGQWK